MTPHPAPYDTRVSPLSGMFGDVPTLPYFSGWGTFGDIPTWQGLYPGAPQLSYDDLRRMAEQDATDAYGNPDAGQVASSLARLTQQYQSDLGNLYGGSLVKPAISGDQIANRVGTMRNNYGYDPNYIRSILPDGFEDFIRQNKDEYPWNMFMTGDLAEGLGQKNNYSLGPVDDLNYMFLGSRGARPQDNPASAAFAAQQAIQALGGPAPSYGDPNNPELLSYVVPTATELATAGQGGGNRAGGSGLAQADAWAETQAREKMQENLRQLQSRSEDDFVRWANFNRTDPEVISRFGEWSGDALGWNKTVGDYFRSNPGDPFVTSVIGADSARGLSDPNKYLTDPSWGMLGQSGRQTLQSDTPGLIASRQENMIRQQQAYNSIGDGQWAGVLNEQTYSNPAFRQITGQAQQPSAFSSFGTWGGLGGLGGTPSFGANPMLTGTTFNPNPFGTTNNKSDSPWGGPWGGR